MEDVRVVSVDWRQQLRSPAHIDVRKINALSKAYHKVAMPKYMRIATTTASETTKETKERPRAATSIAIKESLNGKSTTA